MTCLCASFALEKQPNAAYTASPVAQLINRISTVFRLDMEFRDGSLQTHVEHALNVHKQV